ncbi:MAG: GHMP kinase [Flavobacteriaceae bacterium]|nr:GHMP kinase [Flavobacteriaceae bacterium]
MNPSKTFRSKGKLLLTGEYTVLDGALSLAIPTQLGQSLHVHFAKERNNKITWLAYKNNGELWFKAILDIQNKKVEQTNNTAFSDNLLQIFLQVQKLETPVFNDDFGYECETQLEFPENWGLGSSSTLINNIAKWAKVNPYQLLSKTFGGSGYDIACADAESPITYQLQDNKPITKEVFISSKISDNLLFIHLNQKQNSGEGIRHYRQKERSQQLIEGISDITRQVINPKCTFEEFSTLMMEHEKMIADFMEIRTVKERLFPDYPGFIKSLGAWGGDFIMAEKIKTSEKYFKNKGYKVIKKYDDLLI